MPDEEPDTVTSYTENAGFWVKIIREDLDRYRLGLTNPAVLTAVGDVRGLTVLDGGCAEGYLSRELARRGASVSGVDICAPLVNAAMDAADEEGLNITYGVANLADLPAPDGRYDVVVLNHVAQDIPNLAPVFAELSRVTKTGGRVVLMMLHPCFYSAHAEREAADKPPTPADYFAVRAVRQPFVVAGVESPAEVTVWLRPLEEYARLLTDNGFVITGLSEPHPSPEMVAEDPWWSENFVRPLFLLLTATKAAPR